MVNKTSLLKSNEVHIKDGLIERIEENLNHDSSPFGKNGFMK